MRLFTFSDKPITDQPYQEHGVITRRVECRVEDDSLTFATTFVDIYTNVPHIAVHHSPDGFEFGYEGSGCSDLALNIVQAALIDLKHTGPTMPTWSGHLIYRAAWSMYRDFKRQFVAPMPQEGAVIAWSTVLDWVKPRLAKFEDKWIADLLSERGVDGAAAAIEANL